MPEDFVSRKPDYKVSALLKDTNEKGTVGVAWEQPDGSIRIKLNSFTVLYGGSDLVLTLFRNDQEQETTSPPNKKQSQNPQRKYQGDKKEGPVPF